VTSKPADALPVFLARYPAGPECAKSGHPLRHASGSIRPRAKSLQISPYTYLDVDIGRPTLGMAAIKFS